MKIKLMVVVLVLVCGAMAFAADGDLPNGYTQFAESMAQEKVEYQERMDEIQAGVEEQERVDEERYYNERMLQEMEEQTDAIREK